MAGGNTVNVAVTREQKQKLRRGKKRIYGHERVPFHAVIEDLLNHHPDFDNE